MSKKPDAGPLRLKLLEGDVAKLIKRVDELEAIIEKHDEVMSKHDEVLNAKHLNHELEDDCCEEDVGGSETNYLIGCYSYYIHPGSKASKGFKPKKPTLFLYRGELGNVKDDGEYVWQEGNTNGVRKFRTPNDARGLIEVMLHDLEGEDSWDRLGVPGDIECKGSPLFCAKINHDSFGNILSVINLDE